MIRYQQKSFKKIYYSSYQATNCTATAAAKTSIMYAFLQLKLAPFVIFIQ